MSAQEYSFYRQGTHRVETVTSEGIEEARKDAAFLLNTSIERTIYLPPLPPLHGCSNGHNTVEMPGATGQNGDVVNRD